MPSSDTEGVSWDLLPPPAVFTTDGDMCQSHFNVNPQRNIPSILRLCSEDGKHAIRIDESRGKGIEWPGEIIIEKTDWPDGPFDPNPDAKLVLVKDSSKPAVTYILKRSESPYRYSDLYQGLLYTIANATSFLKPFETGDWALIDTNPFCIDKDKLRSIHQKPLIISQCDNFIAEMREIMQNAKPQPGSSVILQSLLPPCFDQKFSEILTRIEEVRDLLVFVLMPTLLALGITNLSTSTSRNMALHRSLITESLLSEPATSWPKNVQQWHDSLLQFEQEILMGTIDKGPNNSPRKHIVARVALFAYLRFMIEAMRSSELTCASDNPSRFLKSHAWYNPAKRAYQNQKRRVAAARVGSDRSMLHSFLR